MDDTTLRINCLKAASRVAGSAGEMMRLAWAFECYAVAGYNCGAAALTAGVPAPVPLAPAAPERDAIDETIDRLEKQRAAEAAPASNDPPTNKIN